MPRDVLSAFDLRHAFIEPDGASPLGQAMHERMDQLVLEGAGESRRHARQPLDRNANLAVIDGAGPAGTLRDVGELLRGVENDRDRIARGKVQRVFELPMLPLERFQNLPAECLRNLRAFPAQNEMAAFGLPETALDRSLALDLLDSLAQAVVGTDREGLLPQSQGALGAFRVVISESLERQQVRGLRGDLLGHVEVVEGLGVLLARNVNLRREEQGVQVARGKLQRLLRPAGRGSEPLLAGFMRGRDQVRIDGVLALEIALARHRGEKPQPLFIHRPAAHDRFRVGSRSLDPARQVPDRLLVHGGSRADLGRSSRFNALHHGLRDGNAPETRFVENLVALFGDAAGDNPAAVLQDDGFGGCERRGHAQQ